VDDRPAEPVDLEIALPPPGRAMTDVTLPRWLAFLQMLIVSGLPTQILVALLLVTVVGMPFDAANLSLQFFATLSFIDTALVVLLIRVFLAASQENPAAVLLGSRPWRREAWRGVLLVPVVFLTVSLIVLAVRTIAPWMHNVDRNPLENFMDSPLEAAAFLVVVVLAGGVREEIQRGFILHRFEQRLGGATVGLILFSAAFGLLHVDQGYDAAVGIGLLGLLWGLIYIRRRSVVAPMVNHACFNAAQVLQGLLVSSMGW